MDMPGKKGAPNARKLTIGSLFAGIQPGGSNSDSNKQAASKRSGVSKSTGFAMRSGSGTGQTSRNSKTCGPLGEKAPSNPLMFSAGDSHVKISQEPALAPAYPEPAQDSGGKWCVAFAWFDQDTQLWRTWQCCLGGEWEEFLGTWPKAGMTRNGIAYGRQTLNCLTVENVSSLLPTPTRCMGKRGWGLSKTGRLRYAMAVTENALRFGYKPPMRLLEWMMGFPKGFIAPVSKQLETPSRHPWQNTLENKS